MMPQRAYVLLPRHTTSVERGMRKYSTVRASANEFGGMMQTSDFTSTNDFSSKFFGSTIVELMFVKILNSFAQRTRSEEHTSELQSLMRISYAVFCLKNKNHNNIHYTKTQ